MVGEKKKYWHVWNKDLFFLRKTHCAFSRVVDRVLAMRIDKPLTLLMEI
jgi:hypothetical protein